MNSDRSPYFKGENSNPRKIIEELKKAVFAELLEKSFPESPSITEGRGDEADQAKEECTRKLSLLLMTRGKQKLQALKRALEKIDEGTYGICEECEDPIGAGRLNAMPLARLCVTCQLRLEKEEKTLLWPKENLFPNE